ncbi:MAG TPA: C40 family peptidase [Lentimicrobium sp.]|nr:C40 family peptidase [Lentimicrobium sp.]
MAEGLCTLSIIPVRSEPSGKSTMVNQLLFGDRVEIIEESPNWIKIKSLHDNYEGWCERNQITVKIKEQPEQEYQLIHSLTATFLHDAFPQTLVYGSTIPYYSEQYMFNGVPGAMMEGIVKPPLPSVGESVVAATRLFINTPYLWGGRSPFGVDCSGLVQIAFKMAGKLLPRDAWQQAEYEGRFIDLINETRPGDVAFFDNDEGVITHAGILTATGLIVHASGKVRVDNVDHFGIFNTETGKYTHKLRIIKRFF